jgi:hypothetical protein
MVDNVDWVQWMEQYAFFQRTALLRELLAVLVSGGSFQVIAPARELR